MKEYVMVALFLTFSIPVFAQEPCIPEGERALAEANRNRAVISDLNQMRAWYHDIGGTLDDFQSRYGEFAADLKRDLHYGVAWMSSTDRYAGFETCTDGLVGRTNLDRGWKGAFGYTHDVKRRFGYELFYLTTKDQLKHRQLSIEYGWFQSVAGARGWFRDWISITGARIHREGPARNPKNSPKSGGMYINIGIPKLNLSTDIVTQPGSQRPDLLSVELSKIRVPGGPSFAFATGYYDQEAKVVSTLFIDDFSFLSLRGSVEYDPFRLRSLELRMTPNWNWVFPEKPNPSDIWTRFDLEPYLEVSVYRSLKVVQRYDLDWIPGGAVGLKAQWVFGTVAIGGDGYVGLNRAIALDRLTESYGRTQYGARFFLRIAL